MIIGASRVAASVRVRAGPLLTSAVTVYVAPTCRHRHVRDAFSASPESCRSLLSSSP